MNEWDKTALTWLKFTNDGAAGYNPNCRSCYRRSSKNLPFHPTITAGKVNTTNETLSLSIIP